MQELTMFISNVGFPIVACIYMFNLNNKLTESITRLNDTMKSVKDELIMLKNKIEN